MNHQAEMLEQQLMEERAKVAALEAEKARGWLPKGYVVVPRELTDEIAEAIAVRAAVCGGGAFDIYEAMLAAAPAPAERDWPEDATHENGQYYNRCVHCGNQFVGHKRRPACKACSAAPAERVEQDAFGWFTEDHDTDKSATTYSRDVADRWVAKGWPVWPLYTAPQPSPSPAAPDVAGLEREAKTERQVQRACGELPEGWSIQIELENGAGYAVLYNPQGDTVDYGDDYDGVAEQIEAATDYALATFHREG